MSPLSGLEHLTSERLSQRMVQKCSILIPLGSCLDILPILHSIVFEPIDIRSIQAPELNQLVLGHPVTGDGWGEDGRIPDLLDFCNVSYHI